MDNKVLALITSIGAGIALLVYGCHTHAFGSKKAQVNFSETNNLERIVR